MKHRTSGELYAYWQRLRAGRPAPDRSDVEPADIRAILGDTFILEVASAREYRFRLAGTRLCALYGREMKGRDFLALFDGKDRESVASMLAAVSQDAAATVLGLGGKTELGRSLALECLLLPLRQQGEGYTRVLGSIAPMDDPYWIGIHPILKHTVSSLRLILPDETAPRRVGLAEIEPTPQVFGGGNVLVANFRRRVKHLTVYEGGKE